MAISARQFRHGTDLTVGAVSALTGAITAATLRSKGTRRLEGRRTSRDLHYALTLWFIFLFTARSLS